MGGILVQAIPEAHLSAFKVPPPTGFGAASRPPFLLPNDNPGAAPFKNRFEWPTVGGFFLAPHEPEHAPRKVPLSTKNESLVYAVTDLDAPPGEVRRSHPSMDAFAAYGSGSEEEQEETPRASAFPVPAWEAADESDGSQEDAACAPAETTRPESGCPTKRAQADAGAVGEPKKRKLLDPFAAMSAASASSSFLSKQVTEEETEAFSAVQDQDAQSAAPEQSSEREVVQALPAKQAPAPAPAVPAPRDEARMKEETVRQKNARKQRLGQAKFTVKSNRECPDIWQGAS